MTSLGTDISDMTTDLPVKEDCNLIWHFTGASNLYPILRNGLLATHQAFMNDTSDCLLCRRVTSVMAKLSECLITKSDQNVPDSYKDMLSGLYSGTWHSIFLACFSSVLANPLLWRCYTSNGGFAIGVDKDALNSSLDHTQQLDAVRFGNCLYKDWDEIVRNVYDFETRITQQCNRVKESSCTVEEAVRIFADFFEESLKLERELAFHKNPFFTSENEVRIMYAFHNPVDIDNLLVLGGKPRIQIPLSVPFSSLVRRIIVSPLGDSKANLQLAHLLASSIGLPLVKVEIYDAPVR